MMAKLRHGFSSIRRLSNQLHVWLRSNNRAQAFTEDRMVFNAQDANQAGRDHAIASLDILNRCLGLTQVLHRTLKSACRKMQCKNGWMGGGHKSVSHPC